LVILLAWWFQKSGPDTLLMAAALPGKRSPPGTKKGSLPVMGILFH
jgi:hypothetical protein